MSDAREDKDWQGRNQDRDNGKKSVSSPDEEIGLMHYSTENYTTALEYLARALESPEISNYPDRFRILLRISDCYRKKGQCSKAKEFLEKARIILDVDTNPEVYGKIELREAYVLLEQGLVEEALKIGFSAYRRLKHSDEHNEVADIQLLVASCYHRLGLTSDAEDFYMDALSSYRRIDDRVGIAYAYNNLGLLHKNACRWNRAIASMSKSLELAKSLGLTQHLIRVQLNLGVVYAKLRRFPDALSSFVNAANMAERFGDKNRYAKIVLIQGRTYIMTGDFTKAEKYLVRGQAIVNDLGYGRESALADEYLGELMIARGKYEEALVNLNNGLRKARKIAPEGDMVAEIMTRLAQVHDLLGDPRKALALVEEGLEVANSCGEYYEMGYLYRTRGLCQKKLGDLNQALLSFKTSVEMFDQFENPYEKVRSEQLLARCHIRLRNEAGLLKAKQILSDCVVSSGKIDDTEGQIQAQMLLAAVERNLGNLDDALLAIFEAGRLADEADNPKCQKYFRAMQRRIEAQMASATTRVIDQFSILGDIHSGARSRDKLIDELDSTLKVILQKTGAQGGFIAIPNASGRRLEVASSANLGQRDSRAVLAYYLAANYANMNPRSLNIVDCRRDTDLRELNEKLSADLGTLVFQGLGFENEKLGLLCVHQGNSPDSPHLGQDALHFIGAYSSLLSLSVYELIRIEKKNLLKPKPQTRGFESIVTENQSMLQLLNLAERVAHSDATVLLQGETGTGKGLIAYAIHLLSERRDKKFVHVNCAALPETLLESELFGHVRGAFTGAIADKEGLLKQAHGGTVFLDEIGKTSLAMQGKLLQFLDNSKVRKVGSNELVHVDVRVICASKVDLMKLCQAGNFLEDFFYRINDFPLTVPPLRDRRDDIPLLFYHYLHKLSGEMGKSIDSISKKALECLKAYPWPGNVRELEKVTKRAVILADDGETIDLQHFPPELAGFNGGGRKPADAGQRLKLKDRIAMLEKDEILASLKRNEWNKSQVAIELGMSYPNLLAKIKRYRIQSY
jgi:transcriptional regulator with GAF, ATPase, and Fis domain